MYASYQYINIIGISQKLIVTLIISALLLSKPSKKQVYLQDNVKLIL